MQQRQRKGNWQLPHSLHDNMAHYYSTSKSSYLDRGSGLFKVFPSSDSSFLMRESQPFFNRTFLSPDWLQFVLAFGK
jgi:hypothetical protein